MKQSAESQWLHTTRSYFLLTSGPMQCSCLSQSSDDGSGSRLLPSCSCPPSRAQDFQAVDQGEGGSGGAQDVFKGQAWNWLASLLVTSKAVDLPNFKGDGNTEELGDLDENSTCLYNFSLRFDVIKADPQRAECITLPVHCLLEWWFCFVLFCF